MLDESIPTVLRYARVKHPAVKLQTAGVGRDYRHLAQLPAETWTPTSRTASQSSDCTLSRAVINYMVTMGPPVAIKRYFKFESSRCHHLSHAPRGLQPPPGTAEVSVCLDRGYGARETFWMVGGIVAVNPVAREHARICICRRQLVSWVK